LRPPSTKTTDFEVKNRYKSAKEAKAEYLLWSFFSCFRVKNAFSARMELDKLVMVDRSNSSGIWGQSSQSPGANGGSEAIFTVFSKKNTHF